MKLRFHNDVQTYVSHYTSNCTALDLILNHGTLRLGSLISTNDPRETKGWNFAVGETWGVAGDKGTPTRQLAQKNPDFNRIVRSGCRVLCVSEDQPNAAKLEIHQRSYGKPRMWAQYGGNHTGVCLIFDKKALDQAVNEATSEEETVFSGKIDYGDFFEPSLSPQWMRYMKAFSLSANEIRINGIEDTLLKHRDEFIDVFFLQKNADWENESEFRWINRGKTNEPKFISIKDSLRAVLLGTDFPSERLGDVHVQCTKYDAHVGRILWLNGRPQVDWVPPNKVTTEEYLRVAEFFQLLQ